jgi:hypothetical protein
MTSVFCRTSALVALALMMCSLFHALSELPLPRFIAVAQGAVQWRAAAVVSSSDGLAVCQLCDVAAIAVDGDGYAIVGSVAPPTMSTSSRGPRG